VHTNLRICMPGIRAVWTTAVHACYASYVSGTLTADSSTLGDCGRKERNEQ
jgi:hypothetical protein